MIKEYSFYTEATEPIANWFAETHPDSDADIDTGYSFLTLYMGLMDGDIDGEDALMVCGEDTDIMHEVLDEIENRVVGVDHDELMDKVVGW